MDLEDQKATALERARKAVSLKRSQRPKPSSWWAVLALVATAGFMWASTWDPMPNASSPSWQGGAGGGCANDDPKCLGEKHLPGARPKCTAAIEGLLAYEPEWTGGILEPQFRVAEWYQPPTTLIYTGDQLLVQNEYGAKSRQQYFCVVSASTGEFVNAGLPSLGARLIP